MPTTGHVVALTFDAGANGDGVAAILATLKASGVPGTFFLTGDFATRYPALARSLAAAGRLGDHTVNHPHLPALTDAQAAGQLLDAGRIIEGVTGRNPAPLFRFPYGDYTAHLVSLVNRLGFVPIGWTVDTLGWEGKGAGITVSSIVNRVTSALTPGEIVLMHVGSNPDDGSTLDADALSAVIRAVKAAGYGFVSLSALF